MKHVLSTLAFYASNGGWHTYKKDRATCNAIKTLVREGYIKVNTFHQACFTGKTFHSQNIKG
jgi:hypothetical protein